MTETRTGHVFEWRIENLSQWCAEVHGEYIRSPRLSIGYSLFMELYPKGIGGKREHLVVRLCDIITAFTGDLSLYCSDGVLLCKQLVNTYYIKSVLELPAGPKFKEVLSKIGKGEDFITVKLRIKGKNKWETRVCTTINVLKVSLEINPKWIEELKSDETKEVFHIQLFSNDNLKRMMWLKICSEMNKVHFEITPENGYPFAVELCMSLRRSDAVVYHCGTEEQVFPFCNNSPWRFPHSLQKKELDGKVISLFICLKTKHLIQSPLYMSCPNSCVSIESKNKICFPETAPTTDTVASNEVEALTKDPSDMPDDPILLLSKELMCLYQDQEFSDVTLKCENVSFPVHRNILSARSPVFKTMLSTDMKEAASGSVDIGDLDPSTLSRFLTYLYTGAVEEELQCDRALKLYYAADKYQVPSLKKECSKFLCDSVSISNVCDVLSLADRHGDDQLITAAHDFILGNYNDVLKSKEWESFMSGDPLLAVKTVTHFAAKDSVRKHD